MPRALVSLLYGSFIAVSAARASELVLVAGGSTETSGAIAAAEAKLDEPFAVDFDAAGNLYVVEMTGQRIRKIDAQQRLTTLAGAGAKGSTGDGGAARDATFNGAHHLAVGPSGDLFVADTWNNRIRRIDLKSQTIHPFAGTGSKGFYGDGGPAIDAQFGGVYCIGFTPSGDRLYVADLDNRRIRAIDINSGLVSTVAGNGKKGVPVDGSVAKDSPLADPRAVAADGDGNIYILERSGDALRVVAADGRIRTLIGAGVTSCTDEHGKPPRPLKGPKHLSIDHQGNVLIADTENHLIRKYVPKSQQLINLAGTGHAGAAGLGGPPLSAELSRPHGVYEHASGEIFISDSSNGRVVKIVP